MDLVRLAIVYDTQQASTALDALNRKGVQVGSTLTKLGGASTLSGQKLKGMAIASIQLSQALASGNVNVLSLARGIGHLAGATIIGALVVSVISVVNAFKEFKRISEDVERTIDDMATSARDAREDVRRMLGETPAETNAEKAINRIRAAVRQMRSEAKRLGGAAGDELERQAAVLEGEIPGIGKRARRGQQLQGAREFNRTLQESNTLLMMLQKTPLEQMTATMAIYQKRLEFLIETHQQAGDEAKQLAFLIHFGAEQMRKMERAAATLKGGLEITANAIEDFVTTGTLAFEDFLNNILRLLYEDFTSGLVGNILRGAAGHVGTGSVTVGDPKSMDVPKTGSVTPAVVNFNVYAMDSQDVAQWASRNGGVIAGEVVRQLERSGAMRRKVGGRG